MLHISNSGQHFFSSREPYIFIHKTFNCSPSKTLLQLTFLHNSCKDTKGHLLKIQIHIILQKYLRIPKHKVPVHTIMSTDLYGFHANPFSAQLPAPQTFSTTLNRLGHFSGGISPGHSLPHLMSREQRICSWSLHFQHRQLERHWIYTLLLSWFEVLPFKL